jgi:hypothetical protein
LNLLKNMNLINIIKIYNQIGMIIVLDQIDLRESNYTKTNVKSQSAILTNLYTNTHVGRHTQSPISLLFLPLPVSLSLSLMGSLTEPLPLPSLPVFHPSPSQTLTLSPHRSTKPQLLSPSFVRDTAPSSNTLAPSPTLVRADRPQWQRRSHHSARLGCAPPTATDPVAPLATPLVAWTEHSNGYRPPSSPFRL